MKKLAWLFLILVPMLHARNIRIALDPSSGECDGEYKVKVFGIKRAMRAHCNRGLCHHYWPRVKTKEQKKYLFQNDTDEHRTFYNFPDKHVIAIEVTPKTEYSGRCRFKRSNRKRIKIEPSEQNVVLHFPRDFE